MCKTPPSSSLQGKHKPNRNSFVRPQPALYTHKTAILHSLTKLVPLSNPNRNSLQLALSRAAPLPRFLFPRSINQTLRDRDREASKQPRTNKRHIGGAYIPDETAAAAACKPRKKEGVKVGEEPRDEGRWRKARWRGARWRAMKLTRGRSRQAPGAMDVVSSDTRAQGKKRLQCGPDAAALPPAALQRRT